MKAWLALLPLAASLTLVACSATVPSGPPPEADGAAQVARLRDVRWHLVELRGQPVLPGTDGQPPDLTLHTDGARATGSGGVNRFTGGYELDAGALRFGPLASTRRAGPEPLMQQEDAYFQALASCRSWRIATLVLELADGNGVAVARFTVPAAR